MNKPDPDMFGRLVLTDLASIYAEMARTRMVVELIARHLKLPNLDKKLEIHRIQADETARQLSAEALKSAGFEVRGTEGACPPSSQARATSMASSRQGQAFSDCQGAMEEGQGCRKEELAVAAPRQPFPPPILRHVPAAIHVNGLAGDIIGARAILTIPASPRFASAQTRHWQISVPLRWVGKPERRDCPGVSRRGNPQPRRAANVFGLMC